ncbi:MAG: NADH-quinone oxidoreductase subunit NuoE [Proteobacteria bacterium]|nr:NADH-quinone oxidoreductase subunit NuoE [Pseudomonadota bacterium]NIS69619.1 NADH-quinone oxidoreductase subunit NuoE [Pseudomonadota bacterium]
MKIDTSKVDEVIDSFSGDLSQLIGILQDIQANFNYLPREALVRVSERLEIPLSQVFGVATFFKAFSLTPRGRHQINVCLGTACHVRGGARILEKLERDLSVEAGGTTDDRRFTLESVRCLGCCSLGPVVVIDEDTYGRLNQEKVSKLVEHYE